MAVKTNMWKRISGEELIKMLVERGDLHEDALTWSSPWFYKYKVEDDKLVWEKLKDE